ncbi:MAG: histidine kinase [Lachnospiraceae bacterium]|nr:histidine kinase [Lachnospiraceae bacterium]
MIMDLGTLAILFPMLFLLLGLGFTVVIDPYIQQKQRRIMLLIIVLCLSLIVQNLWENELFVSRSHLALKNFLSAYGYSVRPVFLVLFLSVVWPEGKKWPAWTLAGINALLYFSSPFTKLCFEIRASDFAALWGPLWLSCILVSGALLLQLLVLTIIRFRETQKLEQLIPVSVALVIAVSVALDMHVGMLPQPVAFLTMAIVIGSVFYYIWLHLQFVRQHENDLMASQRIQIMMTQIQPHFLFNALNTIRALYAKDPPLADQTLEDFSTYLRQNLESLNSSQLIPFERELEHTRLYAEIEVLRFPDARVEYRIEDDQFEIPALTIQPLVENAIRHGIRYRKDGLVTITARRDSGWHQITIQDNGVGFDTKEQKSAGGTHVGLINVKDRIEQMCRGTMAVKSEIGKGTSVTLRIPDSNVREKKGRKNEGDLRG